jgi:sugar fermentation stimulation protein A
VRFSHPLRHGSFTRRVNRFLASIRISGREEYAHVPNSGRMEGLLTLGRPIRLRERNHRGRKTRYDLSLVHCNGHWVSIDARLPGTLLVESIENGDFPELMGCSLLKREVPYRSSRIDLLLGRGTRDVSSRRNPSRWSMAGWRVFLMPQPQEGRDTSWI